MVMENKMTNSPSVSSGAGVTSFNSRDGDVLTETGDYTASQITNIPSGNISATDVQAAIDELDAAIPTFFVESVTGNIVDITDPANPVVDQVQSDWNQTDTLEVNYIANKPTVLNYNDAIVNNIGVGAGKFATLTAALASGATRIFVSASFTETSVPIIVDNTIINFAPGVTATFGSQNIGMASGKSLTINGGIITYNRGVSNNSFVTGTSGNTINATNLIVVNAGNGPNTNFASNVKLILNNCDFSTSSTNNGGVYFDTVNSSSYNCIFRTIAVGATNIFKADFGEHYNPYIVNSLNATGNLVVNNANSTIVNGKYIGAVTAGVQNAGKIYGFAYISGGGSISMTSTALGAIYTNLSLNAANVSCGAFANQLVQNLYTSGNITSASGANTCKFSNVNVDSVSLAGNNNLINDSTASSSYSSTGTGTIRGGGNNTIIGNDYNAVTGTHTTTWSGPYTSPVSGPNINYSLEDGNVNLLLGAIISAATTPSVINMTTVLPSTLWPSVTQVLPILVVSASINFWGVLRIDTSGNIQIWSSSVTSSTFAAGSSGFYATTIKYKT